MKTPTLASLTVAYETRLNAPSLTAPGDGATANGTPTFQWTAVTGAASYLLQLDTAASFNSPNLRNVTVLGGTTSYTPTSPLADGSWYWRVAANDSGGELGAFTPARTLHIDTSTTTTTTTTTTPPPIPGFPILAVVVGIATALASLVTVRRRRKP